VRHEYERMSSSSSSSSSSSYVCDPTGTTFPANGRFSYYTCDCESYGSVVSANLYDGSGASHSRTVTSCQAEANLVMGDVHGTLGYPGNPHNYFWYTENQALTDAFVGQSYGANLGASDSQAVRIECLGGLCVPTGQYYYGYALYNSGAQNSPFLFQSGYQTGTVTHMRGNFQCCGFLSASSSSTGSDTNATSTSNSPWSATEMDKIDVSLAMSAVSLALSIVVTVLFVIQACRRPRAPRPIFVQPQPHMYK
jgi:hypothetical protein